jgi:hypothetical protein
VFGKGPMQELTEIIINIILLLLIIIIIIHALQNATESHSAEHATHTG